MRIILFTGKGGVGKTTISAATAVHAAHMGYRTLVMSTDQAHSLADSFDIDLDDHPVAIETNLWAQEINVLMEMEENWRIVQDYVASVMTAKGLDELIAEEMAVFPGMDELFSLLEIRKVDASGKYDCLIIDCAPTAQTLRLLSFPDVASWYMQKFFPIERTLSKAIRPVIKSFMSVPVPKAEVFDSIEKIFTQLEDLKALLTDANRTSVRLVVNPEKMVIRETQRAYTYLSLYGYPVDCVITNRILPSVIKDKYFEQWHHVQDRYRKTIGEAFSPLPIREASLMDTEVIGNALLAKMAEDIYKNEDPTTVFFREQPQKIQKTGEDYILRLKLPFTEKKDIQILQTMDQLIVRVGNYRREIILPTTLAVLSVEKAKLQRGELMIVFKEKSKEGNGD